jgi:rhamnogalacturonyl hydrolase YesR
MIEMTKSRWIFGACLALSTATGCSQGDAPDGNNAGKTSGGSGGTGMMMMKGGSSGSGGSASPTGGSTGTTGGTGGSVTAGGGGSGATGGAMTAGGSGGAAAGGPATGGVAGGGGGSGGALPNGGMPGVAGDATAGGTGGTSMGGASMGGASACPIVAELADSMVSDDSLHWPMGDSPTDVGKLAVNDMKTHTNDTYGGAGYSLILTWYGALKFTQQIGDTANNKTLIDAFAPYLDGTKTVENTASSTVDYRVFGVLPLEIFIENGDTKAKDLGLARADAQWAATTSDGITKDARYWIDDMYMITGLQVMAYRATKDTKYLDRAAKTMIAYIAALQQTDGFFWHTKDSHAYWGRANGWVAAGMTELLLELPAGMQRDSIMAAYKKQMDALLTKQISGGNDDGCWRQVVDLDSANAESSCTAMFTYALATGAKNGWITDAKYAVAARKGWLALAAKTDSSGKLDRVCPGTGAAPSGSLSSQQQFYATISLAKGDLHGQAPLLWSAYTLLRTDCPGLR